MVKNIKRQRTMGALEKSVGMFAAPPQGEPAAAAIPSAANQSESIRAAQTPKPTAPNGNGGRPPKQLGSKVTYENWKAWRTAAVEFDITQVALLNMAFDYVFQQGHVEEIMGLREKYEED